ncbi:MAG TPA: FAD-dependent oxidoreductase [Gaiellaceae bacterium]|jgi:glutamate synthase (NADPH/NADH) small chain|nr:FAD-dependent oxidoreductase [Gaiellaceae bacterium]
MAEITFPELRPPLDASAAVLEADRCLDCSGPYAAAPCTAACPAGVDVPRFVRELAAADSSSAAATIYRDNLLGGTCARVCPVEVLCEAACVLRHERGHPISIAALQRFATDEARRAGLPLRGRAPARSDRVVVVVGAGPAGLSCAGELAARGLHAVVLDDHDEVGGIVRTAIAPYRQGVDPLPAEREALAALGVEFRLGTRVGCVDDVLAWSPAAVFLAPGLGGDRELECPGTELAGYWRSLDFIAALKEGRPPEVGSHVVVLGGGNTAIDVAREAVRLGARATVAYRRTRDRMPAYRFEVDEAAAEGVRFEWRVTPVAILGAGRVEAIVLRRDEEELAVSADTVVAAIGQVPRPELDAWRAALEEAGVPVFAGGDAVNGGASVVQAVADGKAAAREIEEATCRS